MSITSFIWKTSRLILITVSCLLCLLIPQTASSSDRTAEPVIRLITIAPTHHLFEWFGHIALEVDFRPDARSIVYNYGGFSFQPEDFLSFMMGHFTFWSFIESTPAMIAGYSAANRHIVIQTLDLSIDQKKRLIRLLRDSTRPENSDYSYDHFRENCSTRIRDLLNIALDNALLSQTEKRSDWTYRDLVNQMTRDQWALNFLLNTLLADRVDQPITKWDTLFLPSQMMMTLQDITTGNNTPLIIKTEEITNTNVSPFFKPGASSSSQPSKPWAVGAGVAMIFGLAFMIRQKTSGGFRKLFPLLVAIYGLCVGTLGVILFFMSVVASHVDTFWNENLFLANPVTFLLFPLGCFAVVNKFTYLYLKLCVLCGMLCVLGLILKILPAFDQHNTQQLIVLLPVAVIIGLTGVLEGRQFHPPD